MEYPLDRAPRRQSPLQARAVVAKVFISFRLKSWKPPENKFDRDTFILRRTLANGHLHLGYVQELKDAQLGPKLHLLL